MRRKANGLVPNEELLLSTALTLTRQGQGEFHGYALRELWQSDGNEPATMNYATLYRCLDRLEERGLLESEYDVVTKNGGPPRKMFKLTGLGLDTATRITESREANTGAVPGIA